MSKNRTNHTVSAWATVHLRKFQGRWSNIGRQGLDIQSTTILRMSPSLLMDEVLYGTLTAPPALHLRAHAVPILYGVDFP